MLRCRFCGKTFPLEQFKDLIEDLWEDMLANIPCDRL
jgi:hypothetical protein